MKILLAVDGSACSTKAVKHVVKHADWFSGPPELHLLHVKLPLPSPRARAFLGSEVVHKYYQEEGAAALAPAERVMRKSGIPFHSAFTVGEVAEEVHAYVKKNRIDMIVMGSHGHGALGNLVMGSVATKVLATAKVPVLIIR